MNKTRFYEILQASKKGEDLKQFVPTNAPEAALINDLTGGNGGAEYVEGVVKVGPVEVGSTGDIYIDVTAMPSPEELHALRSTIMADDSLRGQYNVFKNEYFELQFTAFPTGFYLNFYDGRYLNIYGEGMWDGGWYPDYDFVNEPIVIKASAITELGKYNDLNDGLLNKLFYIGKKESKLVANADITSEQLNDLNKVEVVTSTETKVIGGESASGDSMVPTYFKFNNPNIKNMYYGMTLPTWNKVKINVASVFDVFARRHHNMSLEELCNSENAVDLIYEISSNGTPKIFELYQLIYNDVDEYNDSPSFNYVDDNHTISMCVAINDYGNSDDDYGFELRFKVQEGSGNYENVVVNINTAAGNLYSEFVNAGTIEYNIGQYRFDGYSSGDVAPTVYFIFNIFNTIDLNKLEKFDAISFE